VLDSLQVFDFSKLTVVRNNRIFEDFVHQLSMSLRDISDYQEGATLATPA
jgi:hypothetical protein